VGQYLEKLITAVSTISSAVSKPAATRRWMNSISLPNSGLFDSGIALDEAAGTPVASGGLTAISLLASVAITENS
jgi:hypothetical protein